VAGSRTTHASVATCPGPRSSRASALRSGYRVPLPPTGEPSLPDNGGGACPAVPVPATKKDAGR